MTPTDSTPAGGTPVVEPWLRELLRCPACRSALADATGPDGGPELVCTDTAAGGERPDDAPSPCGYAYRVDDGVPVLLVDEARRPA